jgi:uncharacterized membrane protein YkoI
MVRRRSSTAKERAMNTRTKVVAASAVMVVLVGGVGAAAIAKDRADDDERPITGAELERATQAALEHTGGGRVTETEVGDEDSYYEVEVTLDDGSQVDVQLDREFAVVGSDADEAGDDAGESGDDD